MNITEGHQSIRNGMRYNYDTAMFLTLVILQSALRNYELEMEKRKAPLKISTKGRQYYFSK